jgi:hypothetical protein
LSTIKVNNIQSRTGNAISFTSGDTITIPSGATFTNNGTITGLGTTTPAFEAYRTSNQTPSNNTDTKVQCNVEDFDTDNCYDNTTNFRFTPTVAGKYFVYASVRGDGESQTDLEYIQTVIKKNGTNYKVNVVEYGATNKIDNSTLTLTTTIDMNGSTDYIELWTYLTSSVQPTILGNTSRPTNFGAYRLIGA